MRLKIGGFQRRYPCQKKSQTKGKKKRYQIKGGSQIDRKGVTFFLSAKHF